MAGKKISKGAMQEKPKDVDDDSDIELVIKPSTPTTKTKVDTRSAFLGLAIQTFADDTDLGRGPVFTTCTINGRQMNKKRRDNFIRVVGGDPQDYKKPLKDLARFDPEHAIIILVEKKFINEESLVKNPLDIRALGSLKHVQWNEEEKENQLASRATVANGNGRIDICHTVLAPKLIKEMERIKDLLRGDIAKPKRAGLEKLLASVEKELDERACWLVAYYDLDMIERSEHSVKIKIDMASNAPIYQVPDNEDEALNLILDNLCFLPEADRLDNLTSQSTNNLVSCGPKRLMPVVNNTSLIMTIIDLHRYSTHWPGKGFSTNQLYEWRTGVSPFIEAVIKQGIALYDFLASDIEPPSDYKEQWNLPHLKPLSGLFDDSFFVKVSTAYATHIFPAFSSYGVPDLLLESGKPLYADVFQEYTEEIEREVLSWCQYRQSEFTERAPPGEELDHMTRILESLPRRLSYALSTGLFNNTQSGLQLISTPPLLCKFFVIDVGGCLNHYRYALMEIFRMMEPLYCSVLVDGKRETEFKDRPTDFLCAWVKRQRPNAEALAVVNKILSIIFSHRYSALLKIVTEDKGVQPKYPPRSTLYINNLAAHLDAADNEEESTALWTKQYSSLIALMKKWRQKQIKEQNDGSKVLLDYPLLEFKPDAEAEQLADLDYGYTLMEMIDTTAIHWAAFSATQLTSHLKTVVGYAMNTLWMHLNHGLRYLAENEVWNLRQDIVVYLRGELTGFSDLWDGVDEQPGGKKAELSQTAGSGPRKLVLQNVVKVMQGEAEEAMKNILHHITTVTGVQSEERGVVLTKDIYKATESVFEEMGVAIWKNQKMYTDLEFNPLNEVDGKQRQSVLENLQLPSSFVEATDEEVAEHYKSFSENANKTVNVFGTGSLKEQEKVRRERYRGKKFLRRSKNAKSAEFIIDEDEEGSPVPASPHPSADAASGEEEDAASGEEEDAASEDDEASPKVLVPSTSDIDSQPALKRKRMTSSPHSQRLFRRRRLMEKSSPEQENIETPPGENTLGVIPAAPKVSRTNRTIGKPSREVSPQESEYGGFDDETLNELADSLEPVTQLFKNHISLNHGNKTGAESELSQSQSFFL